MCVANFGSERQPSSQSHSQNVASPVCPKSTPAATTKAKDLLKELPGSDEELRSAEMVARLPMRAWEASD